MPVDVGAPPEPAIISKFDRLRLKHGQSREGLRQITTSTYWFISTEEEITFLGQGGLNGDDFRRIERELESGECFMAVSCNDHTNQPHPSIGWLIESTLYLVQPKVSYTIVPALSPNTSIDIEGKSFKRMNKAELAAILRKFRH